MSAALSLMSAMVTDTGMQWGALAADFQWADAAAVTSSDGPRWHFQTRGRGGSKTTDGGLVALGLLLSEAPPMSRSYAIAADQDQGALLLDVMRGLVSRTPGLADAVRVEARRVLVIETGASLEVLSADGPSTFGLLPWMVFADELSAWPTTPNAKQVWEAIVSAIPKVPNARLIVLSSAGAPSHWSFKVLERARTSETWRASEQAGPTPWLEPALLAELASVLPPSAYARLVLNEWTEPEDRLTTADDLRACVSHTGPLPPMPGVRYVASLDMAYVNDRAVASLCHRDGDRVVLDRMEVWQGSRRQPVSEATVEAWLVETSRAYGRPRLVLDPWQTKGMAQRLRANGLHVEEFTFSASSVGRLALTLYRLLRAHTLALPDDEDLLDELGAVRLRETAPGVYRLDHDSDRHDDRAVAIALCAHALVEHAPSRPGEMISAADIEIDDSGLFSARAASSNPFGDDDWKQRARKAAGYG